MNPQTHVFQLIYDQMEVPLEAAASRLVQAVASYAQTALPAALILYIALTGALVMTGIVALSGPEFIKRIAKLALVVWFITDASAYSSYVTDFVLTKLPSDLANSVSTAGNGLSIGAGTFDSVWEPARDAGWQVWKRLDWSQWGEMFIVCLYWAAALAACVIGFAIWMMSHLILTLFVIVGPLLILLVLFPLTSAMLERWIGALLSGILTQFGIVVLLTLMLQTEAILTAQVLAYSGPNVYAQLNLLLAIVAVFGFSIYLAAHMPAWANTLAAGLHFHGIGLVLMMRSQAARAGRVVAAGARAADTGMDMAATRIRRAVGDSLSRGAPSPARTRELLNRARR